MRYDTVIVGAGSAGAVLAARLSQEAHRTVLLLEAGPDYPGSKHLPEDVRYGYGTSSGIVASSHVWRFKAQAAAQIEGIVRGKMTGGSSAVNAQVYLWGLPSDFDAWANRGLDQWAFDRVVPYFQKVETDLDFSEGHGTKGPIQVRRFAPSAWLGVQKAFYDACRGMDFADCPDLNRPGATGVGALPLNNVAGVRVNTAMAYLDPVRHRSNLAVWADVLVRCVRFDGRRATGVVLVRNGQVDVVDAGEVVLCAGAIGSPHLLLLSGIGAAEDLRALDIAVVADRPGVGQNLRDHPAVPMMWQTHHAPEAVTHWHQVGLRYTASGSDLLDDMIVYVAHLPGQKKMLMRPTVNLALSAGALTLASSDVSVPPRLHYNLFDHVWDRVRIREGIRLCAQLVEHDAFGAFVAGRLQPDEAVLDADVALDGWVQEVATTGHHVCGTCQMGLSDDPFAVVDQNGCVYGVDGLRVVDASMMPDCVRANIHATVLMMAECVADVMCG